jgi:hypothetical protein
MNRCNGDPMYTILFYPEEENLLLEYIKLCTKVVIKRYQIKDKEILRVFELLETIDDSVVRKFALLFFIHWETNLAKGLEDAVDETKKTTLYQEEAKKHYNAFVGKMGEFVEKTVKFAYTKYNIIEVVNEFEKAARLEYVMGPF